MLEGKKPNNVSLKVIEKLAKGFNLPPWKLLKF
jgi:hypothetical protein